MHAMLLRILLHLICRVHGAHSGAGVKSVWVSFHVQAGYALSYSLAHLAVPYGGRQDARLEPKYIQKVWQGAGFRPLAG
jgi:hypothetical protein